LSAFTTAATREAAGSRARQACTAMRWPRSPRLPARVLVLGAETGSVTAILGRPLRRIILATVLAWALVVTVSHSFLQRSVAAITRWLGDHILLLADRTDSIPVLSTVVDLMHRGYDAVVGALAAVGSALGGGLVIFLAGLAIGGIALWVHVVRRRRIEERRAPIS